MRIAVLLAGKLSFPYQSQFLSVKFYIVPHREDIFSKASTAIPLLVMMVVKVCLLHQVCLLSTVQFRYSSVIFVDL